MASVTKYNKVAVLLHWLIAIAIAFMLVLGDFMGELPKKGPEFTSFDFMDLGVYTVQVAEPMTMRTFYYNFHKSVGFTLLLLVALRLVWRLMHRPPALPSDLTPLDRKLAAAGHHGLYLMMFLMPISGMLMTLYSKYGLKWFGIQIYGGLDKPEMTKFFSEVHEVFATLLVILIVVHVLGALKHQFIAKNGLMRRMWF